MTLSRTAKIRLNKLIAYMASLPKTAEQHFDMANWFRHDGLHVHKELKGRAPVTRKTLRLCGTQACALGWATTMPYFKKLGLSMTQMDGATYSTHIKLGDRREACAASIFDVARDAFHIDHKTAVYLFRDIPANTPKEWAANAKRYLQTGRVP